MSFAKDHDFAKRFVREMIGIMGRVVISEPPVEEDMERNTDLVILRKGGDRIACRVRRHEHLAKFGDEFTIRCARPTGAKTELEKIREGWGNYLLYGFADATETRLESYLVVDLNAFRAWYKAEVAKGEQPGILRKNRDDGTSFLAFKAMGLPAACRRKIWPPVESVDAPDWVDWERMATPGVRRPEQKVDSEMITRETMLRCGFFLGANHEGTLRTLRR